MKQTPRYTVCSITTKDIELLSRRDELKKYSFTDQDIYIKGIETLEKEILDKS